MYEILIIICLALALFLVFRNYSKAGSAVEAETKPTNDMWQKFFGNREKAVKEIEREINRDQQGIIPPSEITVAEKKFLEHDPKILHILIDADEALEKGDLRVAEESAIEAIKADKKCAQAYVIVGRVAMLRGVMDEAREAYKTAIKCNFGLGDAYFGLGDIELKAENYSEAIENLQKAVSLDRSQAEWYATLGRAYNEVRQFAKAAKAFKRATNIDMDNKDYKSLLSEAEEKQRSHSQVFRVK